MSEIQDALLTRIAQKRDLCRNEGANDIADLLDESGKVIDQMWDSLLAYGYATDLIRRECGLPEDSERMDDINDYICNLKGELKRLRDSSCEAG